MQTKTTNSNKPTPISKRPKPPTATTLPPPPPTTDIIWTTFNIDRKYDVLIKLLHTVQPTILFIQETPHLSSELLQLQSLLPNHFIHYTENDMRGHLSMIHQTWAHFILDKKLDIKDTSRTHQFTFKFPHCKPLTLCNVYGSNSPGERADLVKELTDLHPAQASAGDWNATYRKSHSTTSEAYNKNKLQWDFLKERLSRGETNTDSTPSKGRKPKPKLPNAAPTPLWMDAFEICNPKKEIFTRIRGYGKTQSRLDNIFCSPEALEIMYPEFGYTTDVDPSSSGSDHVAVTIHFSSPIIPIPQPVKHTHTQLTAVHIHLLGHSPNKTKEVETHQSAPC